MVEPSRGSAVLDVVTAAFIAITGIAVLPSERACTREGGCARCGRATIDAGRKVRDTVSRTFTGFDGWTDIASPAMCQVCVWAYTTKGLRSDLMLISSDPPRATRLSVSRLRTALRRELTPDVAIVVPLRPGRKHVLPHATWGRVAVDDIVLPWTDSDADRLSALIRLRRRGFSIKALARDAPDYSTLIAAPRRVWASIFEDWANLIAWRQRPLYLDLASTASAPKGRPS